MFVSGNSYVNDRAGFNTRVNFNVNVNVDVRVHVHVRLGISCLWSVAALAPVIRCLHAIALVDVNSGHACISKRKFECYCNCKFEYRARLCLVYSHIVVVACVHQEESPMYL